MKEIDYIKNNFFPEKILIKPVIGQKFPNEER